MGHYNEYVDANVTKTIENELCVTLLGGGAKISWNLLTFQHLNAEGWKLGSANLRRGVVPPFL